MAKKVIIVGGVAGGASTAARLRRLDEKMSIIMFEKGEYISFANCGLPYYIGGVINERERLIVQTVEEMSKKFNLDIRNFSEVIKIDRKDKKVHVKNHQTGAVYEESYDVLVLSPGAKPIVPPLPGIEEADNLFTLRNIPDTDRIQQYINENKPQSAVVIGGGFIGLEMAENLQERGIDVTLVEASQQVMAPLDFEMASIIHEHLVSKGVRLFLEDGVSCFENKGRKVVLNSGINIDAEMIILAIGVKPDTAFVKEAGIAVNERGGIIVNDCMQTSDEAIYALGDAVAVKDFVTGTSTMMPLAWPANRQGHIVADHISGKQVAYKGSLGSAVAKVFDYTVATTGQNEKQLQAKQLPYEAIHIHPGSHASYYPGAFPIAYKLLFNPMTGKIYGAQGVGIDGVEKRIDILATAIKAGMTVFDLQDVEPTYAPPYNSAKDPVNMLGYYASNIIDDKVKTVQWYQLDTINEDEAIILDVREAFELATGTFEKSINIPLGELRERLDEVPKDKKIYVTCQVGLRGYIACRLLSQQGIDCANIDGGIKTYKAVKHAKECMIKQQEVYAQLGTVKQISCKEEKMTKAMTTEEIQADLTIDACGLQCPGPIRRVFEETSKMDEGKILKVSATDPGFSKDIASWCEKTGNQLVKNTYDQNNKAYVAYIQKGGDTPTANGNCSLNQGNKEGATLVVFSGDLDKAIASFIIATGAASMGKKVTMFFTFWGLNILKRKEKVKVEKDMMEKMFDKMLPSHTDKLPLSQMNMGGMGPKMIKEIMKKHNVDDLDTLIKNAQNLGVELVACAMSMDLMGIKKEELIDHVEIAGVATYLGKTEDSGLNLFI